MSGVITMSRLGRYGRFANQIFQVAFTYCYAKLHGLDAQAPKPAVWPFEWPLSPMTAKLQPREERYTDPVSYEPLQPEGDEYVDKDFHGYGQYHTSWFAPWRDDLMRIFTPSIKPSFARDPDRIVVAIHSRMGDYDNKGFKVRAPVQWYIDWINQNWPTLRNPVLFIAAEEHKFINQLCARVDVNTAQPAWRAVTERLTNGGGSHIQDWVDLRASDAILCPNSTFSFAAAWLSPYCIEAWRASLPHRGFIRFEPWSSTPLLHDLAEDYQGLLDPL